MRILSFDPDAAMLQVDQQAYEVFSQELGIPQRELDTLEIHFVLDLPGKPHAGADFQGKRGVCRIRLRTQDTQQRRYNAIILNRYLLHETKHFQDFCATGRCYAPGESSLPHNERPAEMAAGMFAEQDKYWRLIQFMRRKKEE
jgi:hypothetical protein